MNSSEKPQFVPMARKPVQRSVCVQMTKKTLASFAFGFAIACKAHHGKKHKKNRSIPWAIESRFSSSVWNIFQPVNISSERGGFTILMFRLVLSNKKNRLSTLGCLTWLLFHLLSSNGQRVIDSNCHANLLARVRAGTIPGLRMCFAWTMNCGANVAVTL